MGTTTSLREAGSCIHSIVYIYIGEGKSIEDV